MPTPDTAYFYPSPIGAINSWGWESGGWGGWPAGFDNPANAIPIANQIIYIPFTLQEQLTAYKMYIYNGTAVSGNFDMGIYDEQGNKLYSTGSTVQAGTSALQTVTLGSPLALHGGNYYMAYVIDNITGRVTGINSSQFAQELLGVKNQASTFPLPSTATFAAPIGNNPFPWLGMSINASF